MTRNACTLVVHCLIAAGLMVASPAHTFNAQNTPVHFEVADVKPLKAPGQGRRMSIQPGGRFTAAEVTLRDLIQFAYQVDKFLIVGGPAWADSQLFEVIAKAEGAAIAPGMPGTIGPLNLMVQSLLSERFRLEVRREPRDRAVQALVVARPDKRLGPMLVPSTVDCPSLIADAINRRAPLPPSATGQRMCDQQTRPGAISGAGFPLATLTAVLAALLQSPVLDRTGLSGTFDFDLQFANDELRPLQSNSGAPATNNSDKPSLFAALPEQLGLRLESQRAFIEVLAIERAEPLIPN